jgi:L-lactate dehydrogenase complex protein LldF
MPDPAPSTYRAAARRAIADPALQSALTFIQSAIGKPAIPAYHRFPEGLALRQAGRRIRRRAIDRLDQLLAQMADRVTANGGSIHFAADAGEAVDICLAVARRYGVRRVVKGKSMVTEEIGLNQGLAEAGIEAVETDLGEYIVQLANERPSHIIAPAIHKNRHQIARLFAEKLGIEPATDPAVLTRAARNALRRQFLAADMGISGCNLACAETGHIAVVSNEGNIRLATTLPRVHVAFMGMERIVAALTEHDVILRLLTTAAAAQRMACYLSYIGAPRTAGEVDGPDAFHLVVVDNGRSRILADPEFREILTCIRCAACLNICPVYGKIGGHAYGHPYSGPLGAVLMPLLFGLERHADLYHGETLCGACKDQCPVDIDLPRMLRALRSRRAVADGAVDRRLARWAWKLWGQTVSRPAAYGMAIRAARVGQAGLTRRGGRIRRLPEPLAGWSDQRDAPAVRRQRFLQWWRDRGGGA